MQTLLTRVKAYLGCSVNLQRLGECNCSFMNLVKLSFLWIHIFVETDYVPLIY